MRDFKNKLNKSRKVLLLKKIYIANNYEKIK